MDIEVWQTRTTRRVDPSPAKQAAPDPAEGEAGDREAAWTALAETVSGCTRCELARTRTQTVLGTGARNATWMFVGEAPGAEEDRQGLPFVGRAGKLLDAMLAAMGMQRREVYIANVLKCRPPNNRDPLGAEVGSCERYLHQQVELVEPQLIVALGRFAAQSLLRTTRPIGKLRGQAFEYRETGIPLLVTYHPAYLLRNPLDKRKVWEDLCLATTILEDS
jgi:DNA polymerase